MRARYYRRDGSPIDAMEWDRLFADFNVSGR